MKVKRIWKTFKYTNSQGVRCYSVRCIQECEYHGIAIATPTYADARALANKLNDAIAEHSAFSEVWVH